MYIYIYTVWYRLAGRLTLDYPTECPEYLYIMYIITLHSTNTHYTVHIHSIHTVYVYTRVHVIYYESECRYLPVKNVAQYRTRVKNSERNAVATARGGGDWKPKDDRLYLYDSVSRQPYYI